MLSSRPRLQITTARDTTIEYRTALRLRVAGCLPGAIRCLVMNNQIQAMVSRHSRAIYNQRDGCERSRWCLAACPKTLDLSVRGIDGVSIRPGNLLGTTVRSMLRFW